MVPVGTSVPVARKQILMQIWCEWFVSIGLREVIRINDDGCSSHLHSYLPPAIIFSDKGVDAAAHGTREATTRRAGE